MGAPPLAFTLLPATLAVCRLESGAPVPGWALTGPFVSITRTADELSVICPETAVPAGVDAAWFTPVTAPCLRRDWGVPGDAPLAGIVARMKPERGHRTLLRAFTRVLSACPEAWLVLVGRGEDEAALRALAAQLSPRIVFGGYLRGPGLVEPAKLGQSRNKYGVP